MEAMVGILPLAQEIKVFCFFSSEKKDFLAFRKDDLLKNALLAAAAVIASSPAFAQPQPEPLPYPPPVAAPKDTPYSGTIALQVDITDLARHIATVHETVPVAKPGDFVLLYPQWVPGDHGPTGPLAELASLVIKAGGQQIPWVRDVVNMHAFHVTVPQGATSLDISFQYLSPPSTEGFREREEITPEMADIAWNTVSLYPAGEFSRDITFVPTMIFPKGWHYATALETDHAEDGKVTFKPTPYNTLVDSPIYSGKYFSRIDLAPGAATPVHLNIFADRPEDLAITPDQLAKHRALVQQAVKLFGSQHYNHYDFLFALSDQLGGIGLEHHRSSEDGVGRNYFTDWDGTFADRDLLPHEYTHSWNGKFRRPADLWAPNFNVPERDSLLWVYEGQTEFWGQVLATRTGLWSHAQALDAIAMDAAEMQEEVGRQWRPLQDTTNDPIINERRPLAWRNWERAEDYYVEGLLIWLDADSLIREKTHGAKSLNDFARAFFGMDDGSYITYPYQFDDVVKALNGVYPYDWAGFLRTRLDRTGGGAPLDGITRGGYQLVYTEDENAYLKSAEAERHVKNFAWSVGLDIGGEGSIKTVEWDSPAFKAGLTVGGKIIAINGLAYQDSGDLAAAIKLAKTSKAPIELLVQEERHFRTVDIDYHGGLRYPHLQRVKDKPALLDDLLAPLK
jgi:predicted metalloprotease with PDZ domain